MKKIILYSAVAFVLGIAVGALAMLIAFPFLFPPAEVNESVANVDDKTVTATGAFIHPDPDDPVHWGKGGVSLYEQGESMEVFLEADFEVGPGPDYYLYLVDASDIRNNAAFEAANHVEIARLKSFRGSQVYPLPASVQPEDYQSVVVWCKTFGELITSAGLQH